ncbi:MAG: pilus assembly protein PilM [Candidatus Omnitrophica bacterium]|nr:pilus assembly protein PilM [Candidatus Omnitrophota bacterium]
MRYLGIYVGPKGITLVETKDKKVVNCAEMPQTLIPTPDLEEEKVPAEIKLAESVAFLKNELARNNIEATEATLCLPGNDLFVRSFEMPAMAHDELANAIKFEAEKYIPFKTENLISDYQVRFEKQSRTNLVLFTGLKKETLDAYLNILNQLNIKVNAIEYSGFSVLRGLQMTGVNMKGMVGVLNLDLHGEDEVNFTVLENGFPLFSRDISLTPGTEAAPEQSAEAGTRNAAEKLKTEIQVSLDYYERKFPTKGIKKLYLVSKPECRPDVELIARDVALPLQFIDLSRQIGGAFPYSLPIVKGYTAAISKVSKGPLKLNLLAAKQKAVQVEERFEVGRETSFFEGVTIDARMIGIGLLICAAAFGYGAYQAMPLRQELENIIDRRPDVASAGPAATYQQLLALDEEYQKKIQTLNDLIKKQLFLIEPLNIIPQILPKGMWLQKYSFKKDEMGFSEFSLAGKVYLADRNREFDVVYRMVSDLKGFPEFTKYFKAIAVTSINRGELHSFPVTEFSISCKSFRER